MNNERIIEEGRFIVEKEATMRATAKAFRVSKSTVHFDMAYRLKALDSALFNEVRKILEINLNERHVRGGNGTKRKYEKIKETKDKFSEAKEEN